MALGKVVSGDEAVALVRDGDVIAVSGYGGNGSPESLLAALARRFRDMASPRSLTLVHAGGIGDGDGKGTDRLAEEGLLRRVIAGYFGLAPRIAALALDGKIEAYNLPEGVIVQLYRDIGAGKPGVLSRVGLGTFVDPRVEGGKIRRGVGEDRVELIEVGGSEALFYRAFPIHVAFIRGTTADPEGNLTIERESLSLEGLALAIAAKNCGGYVACQVERVAQSGSLTARQVTIPGILVDCVVVAEPDHHMQTYGTRYNPAFSGEIRVPTESVAALPFDERKIVARRAASELRAHSVVNLGIGLPDSVGIVAREEGIFDLLVLTVDPGVVGGIPMGGLDFGAAVNAQAVIDHAAMFDLIDGGGVDVAVLGMAQGDARGNVNVSRFGGRLTGCGGFINISHRSKKVIFVGTFTSGGLEIAIDDGALRIRREGRHAKFVQAVEQITFSGEVAASDEREVLYVTERCVFRLGKSGLELVEVAPGIDVETQILAHLPFRPVVGALATMDVAIFRTEPMGLRGRLLDIHIRDRISYDAETNTVFMNYAGMHVRTADDVERIKAAVDGVLEPLGRRVYAIVNYDSFVADAGVLQGYADLVKYVEEKYYLNVSRYSTSGFLRLKLGAELARRRLSAQVFQTSGQARRHLRGDRAE
jgi:propionate CoA-transferase